MQLVSRQLASEYLESFCAVRFKDFPRHVPALMSKSILSVSYDAMLLKTRSMLLKGEGYRVVSATGFEQAVTKCKIGAFDLLILGHTVPAEDKRALVKIFHEHCPAPGISAASSGPSRDCRRRIPLSFRLAAAFAGPGQADPFRPRQDALMAYVGVRAFRSRASHV